MRLFRSIICTAVAAGALLVIGTGARAETLLPDLADPTVVFDAGSGLYKWTYNIFLDGGSTGSKINTGIPAGTNPAIFTVYDFLHYKPGSATVDFGSWTASDQALGVNPVGFTPSSDTGALNVTFTYTGAVQSVGASTRIKVLTFSLLSGSSTKDNGDTEYSGHDFSNKGKYQQNSGFLVGAIPEPMYVQLSVLMGLGSLSFLRRRKKA